MLKRLFLIVATIACMLVTTAPAIAATVSPVSKTAKPSLLFIPHDNRPISNSQSAAVVKALGYNVVTPPLSLLGGRASLGDADKLWDWTEKNIKDVDIAVISSDSLVYGSLVASRKHELDQAQLLKRVEKFGKLHRDNPLVKLYAFGSIMRTPTEGYPDNFEEPDYYVAYGSSIFRYTALADKADMTGLTDSEKKEQAALEKYIPQAVRQDWLGRREKNFAVNKALIDLVKQGTFHYFIFGCDDNAPLSQTHMERRKLREYSAGLDTTKFQAMTGIDEMAMLLLARAANEWDIKIPLVSISYNMGMGGKTIPAFADESIDACLRSAIIAAGGVVVSSPQRADVVLAVNTDPKGRTLWGNLPYNNGIPNKGTYYFANLVKDYVTKGYPVCVADIDYANGADNALMELFKKDGLLFKLQAYGGWNTATNSSGFLIGTGMLATRMTDEAKDKLLLTRYLDDWAYQANIRGIIGRQMGWMRHDGLYMTLGNGHVGVEARANALMREFAMKNLPPMNELADIYVTFPWNRMFESDVHVGS